MYIKRSDAVKAIEELPNAYNGWSDTYDKAYIIGTLEEVPTADRPHGEWSAEDANGLYHCDQCNYGVLYNTYHFCPNCGADMRGGDSE